MNADIQDRYVSIRPIRKDDTPLIVKWRNNPRVKQNFIFREQFTEEMHLNWYNKKIITGKVIQFIIEVEGTPIGSVYLRDIDMNNKNAEFGIFIGEDNYIGYGVGKKATKLVLSYAFETMNLHKVFLRVLSYNKRAMITYERCGFSLEGISKDMVYLDGKYYDVVFMAIINDCLSS